MPFGSSKGPLQITKWHSITIVDPSCHKQTIYFSPKYSNSHSSDTRHTKKSSVNSHINTCANLWLKIPKFGGSKKKVNFLTSQKLAPFGPANGQSVTYSKIKTKVCRTPYSTPMDRFLIKSVNPKYPLRCCKCAQKHPLTSTACKTPLSVSQPPKMVPLYSLGTCPP